MSPPAPLAFPGGRTFAAWWRQLVPFHPHALWIAHLFVHQFEVLVRVERAFQPDPLALRILAALARSPATTSQLEQDLGLHPQFLRRAMDVLREQGLAQLAGPNWELTEGGRTGSVRGGYTRNAFERRIFAFLDGGTFLPLPVEAGEPWVPVTPGRFDPSALEACIQRSAEWKDRCGFPRDVRGVVPPAGPAAAPEWQRVVIDHPRHLRVALLLAGTGGQDRLLGFSFSSERWLLDTSRPIFSLPGDFLSDQVSNLPHDAWQTAWKEWSEANGLSPTEADSCRLQLAGHRLEVTAGQEVRARLEAVPAVTQGDAWLLAGAGAIRQAAEVEVS